METKVPGADPPKPEEKPLSPEEIAKKERKFGSAVAELVEKDSVLAERMREIVKLLDNKLKKKALPNLSPGDRKLLEEARDHFREIAAEPYPWFGKGATPDAIKEMTPSAQKALCDDLCKALQDNNDPRTKAINRRIELLQWINVHYLDIDKIINDKNKNPLELKDSQNYLSIYNKSAQKIERLSEQYVTKNFPILAVQRSPQINTTIKELLENATSDQVPTLTSLQTKWIIAGQTTNELVRAAEIDNKELSNLIKKVPSDKLPYVLPSIKKELEERKSPATELKDAKKILETSKMQNAETNIIEEQTKRVEELEKQIKTIDEIIENKIKTIATLPDLPTKALMLELFTAENPQSIVDSLKSPEEVAQLITDVDKHGLKMISLFGEKTYDTRLSTLQKKHTENLVAANERLSEKERKIFGNPESTLESLENNELQKLVASAYLHRREINLIYDKKNAPPTVQEIRLLLNKDVPPIPVALKNKIDRKAINALFTLSNEELELFTAPDPQFTSAFLTDAELIKLTDTIYHDRKEIRLAFGEKAYDNVNELAKARSAISEKTFNLLINPDLKTTLTSLQPNELKELTLDVRLHQTEMAQLFPKTYQAINESLKKENESIALTKSNEPSTPIDQDTAKTPRKIEEIDRATAKAFLTISDRELALCNASNRKSILQNLNSKELINLTADVYVHQKEINYLFTAKILDDTKKALKENNDPKITNAFSKLSDNEINLFRGKDRLKTTFDSLKNPEALGALNLAVRTHRQELIFLFGKDAYQDISKAFAKEYPQKYLNANEKAFKELFLKPDEFFEQKRDKLLEEKVSLLNLIQQKEYSSLSHRELDTLSNQEIKLFTAPTPEDILNPLEHILNTLKTEAPNIDALVKLSKDIRAHRQEITKLFGEKAYEDMSKALIEQYALLTEKKGHDRGRSKQTHYEEKAAATRLFTSIEASAKATLPSGRLREIVKPFKELEAEKEKLQSKEPTSASKVPTTRHGGPGGHP